MTPLELLYQAFNSPHGVAVRTDNLEGFRQKLYQARKEDPDLLIISICVSPKDPKHELWLVKKGDPDAERVPI